MNAAGSSGGTPKSMPLEELGLFLNW
jgi:hypothetical protein